MMFGLLKISCFRTECIVASFGASSGLFRLQALDSQNLQTEVSVEMILINSNPDDVKDIKDDVRITW
jgi:hypothetical protein